MTLIPKTKRERSPTHLAFIRRLPCLHPECGREGSDAAHISYRDAARNKPGRGLGAKEGDNWTVPLCHDCHMQQHTMPEREFWRLIGIDPLPIAERLWECSGDLDEGRATIFAARAA